MRASAASSNAGFRGTLTKHTLQTVNLQKILNLAHESERLKVWPTVIIPINAAASIKFLALKLDAVFIRSRRLLQTLQQQLRNYCIVI